MLTKTQLTDRQKLKDQVESRKHALQRRLEQLRIDSRAAAAEELARIKKRIGELEEAIKDGWDKVTDQVRATLDEWLIKN